MLLAQRPIHRAAAALSGALLLLAPACGSGGDEGGDVAANAQVGATAAAAEHPFNVDERCYVGRDGGDDGPPGPEHIPADAPRPGCSHEGERNLLPVGSVLRTTSPDADAERAGEETLDVVYRAGFVERGTTDDPANPASLRIVVALDVTPVSKSAVEVSAQGFSRLRVVAHRNGSGPGQDTVDECEGLPVPTSTGMREIYLSEMTTYSTLHCFQTSGPESFLRGDPFIEIQGLTADSSVPDKAFLALPTSRSADLDDVLDDVEASIGEVASEASDPSEEAGAQAFERIRARIESPVATRDEPVSDGVDAPSAGDGPAEVDGGGSDQEDTSDRRGPFDGDPDVSVGDEDPWEDDVWSSEEVEAVEPDELPAAGSQGDVDAGGGPSNLPGRDVFRDK